MPKANQEVRGAGLSAFIDVEKSTMLNTKTLRLPLNASLLLVIFASLFFNPIPSRALENSEVTLPDFTEFSTAVQNGQAGILRGVYVPDVLAFPVVQQPVNNAGYVSYVDGELTQFGMPAQFGNVGILAHNNLSGRFFFDLAVGQEVRLVYGDGKVEYFVITQILKYQAFQPNSPYSDFRDLSNDEILTAEQLFKKVYTGDRHVTFQTCIAANGLSTWGRIFVIAEPRTQSLDLHHFWHH
jgi:hypothetical protein